MTLMVMLTVTITFFEFAPEGATGDQSFSGQVIFNVVGGGTGLAICFYIDEGYDGYAIIYNPDNYDPTSVYTCITPNRNITTNVYCDIAPQPTPYVPPPNGPVAPTSTTPVTPTSTGPTTPSAPTVTGPTGPTAPHAPTATGPTTPITPGTKGPTTPGTKGPTTPTSPIPDNGSSGSSLLTGSFVLLLLCFSALFI